VSLVAAARRLHAALEPHAMLIGGICGAMHGVERFTRDVDLASDLVPERVVALLTKQGIACELRRGGADDTLAWVVSGQCDGVDFQVMPSLDVGVRLANAELRAELRIASPRDFIASKCIAGGQQDLHDVAALVFLRPELIAVAREAAHAHGCVEKLEAWLADARLQARYRR
jgi:hypothetical protein